MTHRYWRRHSIVTSEIALQWNRVHKPGGTGMIIRQLLKHSITNDGEDSFNMGRWSYSTIRGRNKRRVTVITVYQTCEYDMVTKGVSTFPSQQWTILEQKGLEEGDIKKQMIKELISFIKKL